LRPRITQKEAQYVATMLKAELSRLNDLSNQEFKLKQEVFNLKYDLRKYREPSIYYFSIPKAKAKLDAVRAELNKTPLSEFVLKGLLVKYEGLANGKLSKGGHPKRAVMVSLSILEAYN